MITNHYWYVPEALSPQQCDELCSLGESFEQKPGIHLAGSSPEEQENYRDSEISWVSNEFYMDLLSGWIQQANKEANWWFDLQTPEKIQYTTYKADGHYDWHIDGLADNHAARKLKSKTPNPCPLNETIDPNLQGLVRKLSLTLNLSKPEDHQGGVLEIVHNNTLHQFPDPPKGSLVVFPSWFRHRITPITQGIRKSAVMWYNGLPLR
tara:strand:+ start:5120 stop:5743 length:624 start_codon:yes stop_codon:yes gene_type:complete